MGAGGVDNFVDDVLVFAGAGETLTAGFVVVEGFGRGVCFEDDAPTDLGVDTLRVVILDGEALEGSFAGVLSF